MDKYLLEILKDVNTIIIPGLGALTITNTDTGEIMFMSYLKHDDGKLSAYIAEKEGMDENDAKNLIAKYVREITTQLDKGESYDMFQFGSFFKDGDDVDFRNWSETSEPQVTPEKEETTTPKVEVKEEPRKEPEKEIIPPVKEEKQEEPEEKPAKKKETKTPVAEKKEEEAKKPVEDEKPKEKETKEVVTPIIPIDETPKEEPKKPEVKKEAPKKPEGKELNILQKEEISANSEKLNKLKEEKEKQKTKKKRGAGFWMLIILIVLIVGGGTAVGIFYDDVKQHIPFLADEPTSNSENHEAIDEMAETLGLDDENTEEVSDEEESDLMEDKPADDEEGQVVEEEQPEETPIEEPEAVETPQVSSSSGGPFHLVAGAFSSEENANRLADKLRAEGYPAKVMFGSGMHMVSVKSYATQADANAGKSEVSDVAPKAWVLEWR